MSQKIEYKNIVGKKYNMLTAIGFERKAKDGRAYFNFICDCGTKKVARLSAVTSGKTKSCGCLHSKRRLDIIGKSFKRLTAIKYVGQDKNRNSLFEFKCLCGNNKVLQGNLVATGKVGSCGCLKKGKNLDIIGKTYNQLTAIRYAGKDKHGNSLFEFLCKCGKKKVLIGSHITKGAQKSCGCLQGSVGKRDPSKALNRIGEVHNRLTIVDIERDDKEKAYKMICTCSCGSGRVVKCDYHGLICGDYKSCGCAKIEASSITGSTIALNNSKRSQEMGWHIDGINVRSGYEVMMILGFKKKNIEFQYEPKVFKLENGVRYTPDFYVPSKDTWIEVKGWMKKKDQIKIDLFRATGKNIEVFMLEEIEAFSEMNYNKLLDSGLYRKTKSKPRNKGCNSTW